MAVIEFIFSLSFKGTLGPLSNRVRLCGWLCFSVQLFNIMFISTGWPGCLVLKQGAVNQLFLGVFLMFLACLDHARWAKFHLGILGPQE